MGRVITSYARDSQFKLSCGHWNLWFKQISSMTPSQFETWLEVEVSQHWFVFYLSCQTITVSSEMVFSLWNSQGDYTINPYINWRKLLPFARTNIFMKNVSAKVNFFVLRFSYLERSFNNFRRAVHFGKLY